MEGIFIYCEDELREAVRARAYKEHRTLSDIGRDALLAATTTVASVEQAWYGPELVYVIARVGQPGDEHWIFAWCPLDRFAPGQTSLHVWSRQLADAASSERWGCKWCDSEVECKQFALNYMRNRDDLKAIDGTPLPPRVLQYMLGLQ